MKKTAYFLLFLALFLTNVSAVQATKISNPLEEPIQNSVETIKPGILPNNPFYFLKTLGENIQTFFTFGDSAKAQRYFKLAEERLAEAKALVESGDVKKAKEIIKNSAKYFERAWDKINILVEAGKESADTLETITDIVSTHRQTLTGLTQGGTEQSKEMLRALVDNDREKLRELLEQDTSQNEKIELIKKFREKERTTVEKIRNLNLEIHKNPLPLTDTTTPKYESLPQHTIKEYNKKDAAVLEHNPLQDDWVDKTYDNRDALLLTDTTSPGVIDRPKNAIKVEDEKEESLFDKIKVFFGKEDDNMPVTHIEKAPFPEKESDSPATALNPDILRNDDPVASLAPQTGSGGKPGMNEDGTTQVARPQGASSGCNTKLYQCKIECGENIINNCNKYSAPKLYDLINCRGDCVKYVIFYGCSMEAGCDEPCWDDYEAACSPQTYQTCINNCEETFN